MRHQNDACPSSAPATTTSRRRGFRSKSNLEIENPSQMSRTIADQQERHRQYCCRCCCSCQSSRDEGQPANSNKSSLSTQHWPIKVEEANKSCGCDLLSTQLSPSQSPTSSVASGSTAASTSQQLEQQDNRVHRAANTTIITKTMTIATAAEASKVNSAAAAVVVGVEKCEKLDLDQGDDIRSEVNKRACSNRKRARTCCSGGSRQIDTNFQSTKTTTTSYEPEVTQNQNTSGSIPVVEIKVEPMTPSQSPEPVEPSMTPDDGESTGEWIVEAELSMTTTTSVDTANSGHLASTTATTTANPTNHQRQEEPIIGAAALRHHDHHYIRQQQNHPEKITETQRDRLNALIKIIRQGSYNEFTELLAERTFKSLLNVFVDGHTALHYSLIYGRSLAWCKQLISNGANPNLTNRSGWHPIHLAAFNGSRETMRYLIDCIAN